MFLQCDSALFYDVRKHNYLKNIF